MSETTKRYRIDGTHGEYGRWTYNGMEPDESGQWVKYDDHIDALAAAQRENERTCQWRYMNWPESDSDYETECGGAWTFIEGGITENGVAFCHRCGGRVLAPSKPKDEEDDVAALRGEGGA